MGKDLELRLYSEARCVSERPELARIAGQRVAIIARFEDSSGKWNYTVYPSLDKSSPTFDCFETERIPVAPIPFTSDTEHMANIVAQTAELRYSVVYEGVRTLLQQRGYEPRKCLLISCGQGNDVNITLVLPNGTVVNTDYREHRETGQAVRFVDWEVENYSDREIELCREILAKDDTSEFDGEVQRYFKEHLAATDQPLPTLKGPE